MLALHVAGAALIVGVAFVTLVIELRRSLTKHTLELIEFLWKIAGAALGLQILTGLYLAGNEWEEVGRNGFFWTKLILLFALGGFVGEVNRRRFNRMKTKNKDMKGGPAWSVVGLLVFLIILILGVIVAETMQ